MHPTSMLPPTGRPEAVKQGIVIRRVAVELILDLRHRVLRPDLSPETVRFEGDEKPDTWHFAVLDETGDSETPQVLSCASFMFKAYDVELAWQLRGMATEPKLQGKHIGATLLNIAEQMVAEDSRIRTFWCNARILAVPFYAKHRWELKSDVFDIPGVGPHRRMLKRWSPIAA